MSRAQAACGELPRLYSLLLRLLPESSGVRLGVGLHSGRPGLGEVAGGEGRLDPALHLSLALKSPQEVKLGRGACGGQLRSSSCPASGLSWEAAG